MLIYITLSIIHTLVCKDHLLVFIIYLKLLISNFNLRNR